MWETADAVAFLQEKRYDSLDDLKADLKDVHSEESAVMQEIRKADKGIARLNEQLHYTGQYYARKTIYKEFVHAKIRKNSVPAIVPQSENMRTQGAGSKTA